MLIGYTPIFRSPYDEEGNRFLANYHTMEEASLVADYYNNHGIKAVIVHGALWQQGVKIHYGVDLHTVFVEDIPDFREKEEAIPKKDKAAFLKEWQKLYSRKNREYEEKFHTLRMMI